MKKTITIVLILFGCNLFSQEVVVGGDSALLNQMRAKEFLAQGIEQFEAKNYNAAIASFD